MALTASQTWRIVAGVLLLFLSRFPAEAASPEDAQRAYGEGRLTDAMEIWAELSNGGDVEAEFRLGLQYDLGNGTPESPETALVLYKLAAEGGLPTAAFNVGAMYDTGRGVARNAQSAALWYARAAARGHHRAQYDLGLLYQDGDGVPQNTDAAMAWFHAAADGGLLAASERLKALKVAARRPASDSGSTQDPVSRSARLTGVTLAAPAKDSVLQLRTADLTTELVWLAPAEPAPVHYEVQVRDLTSPTLGVVYIASMTETATVVPLRRDDTSYAWKVDAVTSDGSHVSGPWNWFSVSPAAPQAPIQSSATSASHASR